MINDRMQAPVGDKIVGIGLLELGAGWHHYDRMVPHGVRMHELTRLACFADAT